MLKSIFFIILLLFAPAYTAFSQEPDLLPPPPDFKREERKVAKSSIRGRVIYEDNGKPVRRAEVYLLRADTLSPDGSKALTDDNGEFLMHEVAAGDYYFSIDVPGVLNPNDYEGFSGKGSEEIKVSQTKLGLFFKKIVTDGVNELQPVVLAKRAGTISGRVTYADGDPAPGLKVEALRKTAERFEGSRSTEQGSVGSTKTDDRGHYRFTGLPPGEYIVFLREKADHTSTVKNISYGSDRESELKTYFPGVATATEAKPLEITAGRQQEGVDLIIPDRKFYKLAGVVLSKADKKPLKGMRVTLQRADSNDLLEYGNITRLTVMTDEEGKWTLKDMPSGNYRAEIGPLYLYETPYENPTGKTPLKFGRAFQEIKLTDVSQEALVTELPNRASVWGTITVDGGKKMPPPAAVVLLQDKYSATGPVTNVEEAKKIDFRIFDALVGDNIIYVFLHDDPEFYVKSIKLGSADLMHSKLAVKEGEEIQGIEIVLSDKPGIVKGTTAGAEGTIDFPRVGITPVGKSEIEGQNRFYMVVPDEDGEFERKVAPGEYFVFFYKGAFPSDDESWEDWYKKQTEGVKKITIKEGETVKVRLDLPKK
jgi:hypothetical protein